MKRIQFTIRLDGYGDTVEECWHDVQEQYGHGVVELDMPEKRDIAVIDLDYEPRTKND